MDLLELAWSELLRSNAERPHPFRYFCLATAGPYPEVRTVVNRNIDDDWSVWFYTDARSPKVEQIRNDNRVSALFYHPEKKLQIRMKGAAEILENGNEDFDRFLRQLEQADALRDYTTVAPPGSPLREEAEILFGPEVHFAAIKIKPVYLDILLLGEVRHQRIAQSLVNGRWTGTKLTP